MQKVTYKEFSVTIREAAVQDGLTALRLGRLASQDAGETDLGYWTKFGKLCAQVKYASPTLGFDPTILATADKATVDAAYQAYLKLPERFSALWEKAVDSENAADDPATGPDPLASDAPLAG